MTIQPDISYAVGMLPRCLTFPTDESCSRVTDGDSDASFEASRSTSGYGFIYCPTLRLPGA
eukprot:6214332-Pleurochrysis_carterae.AAC.2